MKEITNPHLSPSRAFVLVRGRAKRRQGCMRAGLLSNEMRGVRSAEAVTRAEGKTARTAMVRSGRAPRCRRTQARMYVRSRDLGGLSGTTVLSAVVAKVKAGAKRRMHGGEESDSGIVPGKPVNKTWGATQRSRWREGLGATGDAKGRAGSERRVGNPWTEFHRGQAGHERSGTVALKGCRQDRSEEPDALARTSGSGRGPSGNWRATATKCIGSGSRCGRSSGSGRIAACACRRGPCWGMRGIC